MALPVLNNAEAQASGTTVTNANNAGTQTLLDQVTIGANMTLTFDNAHPAHGVNGYKFALTSTATAITTAGFTSTQVGTAVSRMLGAFYIYIAAAAVASSVRLVQFFNGATMQAGIGCTNGLQGFQFRNSADAAVAPLTGTILANTLYRVEFDITFSVAAGSGTINVYIGDNTGTPQGTSAVTAQAFGASAAADGIKYGFNTAAFSVTSGDAIILDDFYLATAGSLPIGPGPYGTVFRAPDTFIPLPFQGPGRNL